MNERCKLGGDSNLLAILLSSQRPARDGVVTEWIPDGEKGKLARLPTAGHLSLQTCIARTRDHEHFYSREIKII